MRLPLPLALSLYLLVSSPALAASLAEATKALDRGDFKTALTMYTKLADAGNARAKFEMGKMFLHGSGVAKDSERGIDLIIDAAEEDDVNALLYVAANLSGSSNSVRIDYYKRAAELGSDKAKTILGLLYLVGEEGIEVDEDKSFSLFSEAASAGYPPAMSNLARSYRLGRGTDIDYERALYWARKGAALGDPEAQNILSIMYGSGEGVPLLQSEAFKYALMSADQENQTGMLLTGLHYVTERGVKRDRIEGHKWLNLSLARTDPSDSEQREKILKLLKLAEENMTPEQLAEAERRANAWRPPPAKKAAPNSSGSKASSKK